MFDACSAHALLLPLLLSYSIVCAGGCFVLRFIHWNTCSSSIARHFALFAACAWCSVPFRSCELDICCAICAGSHEGVIGASPEVLAKSTHHLLLQQSYPHLGWYVTHFSVPSDSKACAKLVAYRDVNLLVTAGVGSDLQQINVMRN